MNKKKILYIDMDNVLVDFQSGIDQLDEETKNKYDERLDEVPGIFSMMLPKKDAIDSFNELSKFFDTYILSTAPWENPSAWSDKLIWVSFEVERLTPIFFKNLSVLLFQLGRSSGNLA